MKTNSLLLAMLCLSIASSAQIPAYSIKGIVADSLTQKVISFATVSLKNAAKQPVRTAVTKNDGSFNFEKLAAGKYTLTLINIGYGSKILPVDLSNNTIQSSDLGKIYMNLQTTGLKAVVITTDKPIIKQEADRITYDLQADPESKGSTVIEMMRKVPMLALDADDNILLNGDGNFKMLINGKPSALVARNPKDLLRSTPASTILRIEVITAPPAKYDAEGLAGIINIVTAKQPVAGYSGTLNVRQTVPVNSPSLGGTFTGRTGKFGFSANASIGAVDGPEATTTIVRESAAGTNSNTFRISGTRKAKEGRQNVQGVLSYEIDSLNLISGQVNYGPGTNPLIINGTAQISSQKGILQSYDVFVDGHWKGYGIDAALNYQLGFRKNKNKFLTFSYRYSLRKNEEIFDNSATNRINYTEPDFKQQNIDSPTEKTIQADYIHPLKNLTIEAGLKGIFRNNDSDFGVFNYNSATKLFEIDPARTDKFHNDQNVFAAYNSYRYLYKSWDFRAGLRIEETVIEALFNNGTTTLSENYFNVVPSIAMSKKINSKSSFSFSYVQRLQRPGIGNLNPFVNRPIKGMEQVGNPGLKPILSNNIQMGFSRSGKAAFQMGLGYSFINNTIMPISVFDVATNVTRTTFENIGKDSRLVSNVSLGYPLSKKWNININGSLIYWKTQGVISSQLIQKDGFTGNFFFGTAYTSSKAWRFNGSMNFNSRNFGLPGGSNRLQGSSNSFVSSSFSANKDLVKDKLAFSGSISNPFTRYRIGTGTTTGSNFLQTMDNRMYFRSFNASINYRFGKLKEGLIRNRRGITNDDVL